MTKKELRQYIKTLTTENKPFLADYSVQICNKILNSKDYKNAQILLGYMALPDEVNLSPVIQDALQNKKQVYLPRIIPDTNKMDFYEMAFLNNESSNLSIGSFGILEPSPSSIPFNFSDYFLAKPDIQILVLIPGRAFSKDGKRLGRGKGFYDLFLSQIPKEKAEQVQLCGVGFSFQIVDKIPADAHDILMNKVFY